MRKTELLRIASQSEVAKVLGVSRQAVSKWRRIPPLRLYQLRERRPEWFCSRERKRGSDKIVGRKV